MGILKNMFGKKAEVSEEENTHELEQKLEESRLREASMADDWRKSKPQLELLARFFRGADPWKFIGKEHWEDVLSAKPEHVIDRLRTQGALVPAPAGIALALRYGIEDLRYMLSERELPVEGTKEELIRRLIGKDPDHVRTLHAEINVLMLSDDARRQVIRYVKAERERREVAERKALVGLLQRDYLRAALAVAEFQEDSVFPRGVGLAFNDEDQRVNGEFLQRLFEKTPALLADIDAEKLDVLRAPAGMAFLWGKDSAASWIPKDFELESSWTTDTICTLLQTHTRYLHDLDRYRDSKYDKFEIWAKNDVHTCASCRSLKGELYRLESLPELPHADCSSPQGCRCSIVVSEHAF
ncbi:hypothetical protein KQI65_08115 [bacterium]|nr:hypothetical protein [bacterium]